MILRDLAKRHALVSSTNPKLILIVVVVAGATVILSVAGFGLRILHRRRRVTKRFRDTCSREPHLTWDEYERRGRLTRSRMLFEDELQRNIMIRKSQQSRASDFNDTAVMEEARPRLRSRTWHGGSRSEDVDAEEGADLLRETGTDWDSAEASVERTWQLLHSKKPPGGRAPLWNEDDEDAPQRPPTVRLKTPPLLSHPIFKDRGESSRPKHMSLPTELTRAKTRPLDAASSEHIGIVRPCK